MSDERIVIALSVVCTVVIGVAAWVIMRLHNPSTAGPSALRAASPAAAASSPRVPASQPGPLASVGQQRDVLAARVQDLEAENRRLRQELESVRQSERSAARAKAERATANTPTIEGLEAFAKRAAPLIEQRLQQTDNDALRDAAPETPKAERKTSIHLDSTDLKKSDSVVNPIVGEVILTRFHSYVVPEVYVAHSLDRCTLQFALRDGRWVLVSGTQKCESDSAFPKTEYGRDRTGETTSVSPQWCKDEIAAAQGGN